MEKIESKVSVYKNGLQKTKITEIEISEDEKSLANKFPPDITALGNTDLMSLWNACLRMSEYVMYRAALSDVRVKNAESVKKYVESLLLIHISTQKVAGITGREQRVAWVRVQQEYIDAEQEYLDATKEYNINNVMREIYQNKVFLCSRELTRRGIESKMLR